MVIMHQGLDVGTKNLPPVKYFVFLLLNLGIVLSRNECSTLVIGSCVVEVLPGASTERNTWMKQPEKNDYQQFFWVQVRWTKLYFFIMYTTVDEVCVE